MSAHTGMKPQYKPDGRQQFDKSRKGLLLRQAGKILRTECLIQGKIKKTATLNVKARNHNVVQLYETGKTQHKSTECLIQGRERKDSRKRYEERTLLTSHLPHAMRTTQRHRMLITGQRTKGERLQQMLPSNDNVNIHSPAHRQNGEVKYAFMRAHKHTHSQSVKVFQNAKYKGRK